MFFKTYIFSIAIFIVFFTLNAIAHDADTLQYQSVRVSTIADCNNLARTYEGPNKTVETSTHPRYDPVNNNLIGYTCTVIVTVHNENHPSHTGNSSPQFTGGAISGGNGGGTVSGGGGDSVSADDTSQDPESVVSQSQTPLQVGEMRTIRVTEYMVRDWSRISGRRLGVGQLPQWIELYNPKSTDLDITGYKFYYASYDQRSRTHKIHEMPISVSITIPGKGAVILATHETRNYGGIDLDQVFVLGIDNVLKKGWRLVDADDTVVHEIGTLFTNGLVGNPIAPRHVNRARQSYKRYASEAPTESYFFGNSRDIGSPGYYKPIVGIAAAPSNPYAKPKMVGLWGKLKQVK